MVTPKFTFAVTAFNEMSCHRDKGNKILACIKAAQERKSIKEIVVVDDASEDFDSLATLLQGQTKVSLYQNNSNRGVFGNKLEAIARATSDWVITCDSDNRMGDDFFNILENEDLKTDTWYCPSFAKPKFNYRPLIGKYDLRTIAAIDHHKIFACCTNTGNQTVHRDSFMQVFGQYRDKRADLMFPNYLKRNCHIRRSHHSRLIFDACDSFIFNSEWLRARNHISIHRGLEYEHFYATGEQGNYARSPREKVDLNILLLNLLWKDIQGANNA